LDKERLLKIKESLGLLTVLDEKSKRLAEEINAAEGAVQELLQKSQREAMDVEQLQKEKLSNTLLRLLNLYEGKLDKEMREMLEAKLEYDKGLHGLESLKREQLELEDRISLLRGAEKLYREELHAREVLIQNSIYGQDYIRYRELEVREDHIYSQLAEVEEAMKCANAVAATAENAMAHLESAEEWATIDVWSRGGLITHIAKYNHMDDAQEEFNNLSVQLRQLRKELKDVEIVDDSLMMGIDSTGRIFDFWFDNIFTDLNVRSKIREDQDSLHQLQSKIQGIISDLSKAKRQLYEELSDKDEAKQKLLIEMENR
jgi:hypothetical protein